MTQLAEVRPVDLRLLAGHHVIAKPPTGSKVIRATPLSTQVEAGNVCIVETGDPARAADTDGNPEAEEDVMAAIAVRNGWAGLVIHGVIRDSVEINAMDIGVKARSYTGGQVKVLTDSAFTKARIVSTQGHDLVAVPV